MHGEWITICQNCGCSIDGIEFDDIVMCTSRLMPEFDITVTDAVSRVCLFLSFFQSFPGQAHSGSMREKKIRSKEGGVGGGG